MSAPSIADQAERARALDPRHSFIVQAPAGSGKTELLVQRFLTLLDTVDSPEQILAITFTRKAAAEMRKRVLEGIAKRAPSRWPLADIGQRLRIDTIDALCAGLTRQMPVLAKFGAQPQMVEDARELYREAADRVLALLESRDAVAIHVERLLQHLDGDVEVAANLIVNMLARRDQWLHKTGVARSRDELEAALVAERERRLAQARALHPDASEELAQQVLTKAGEWRKRPPAPPEMTGNEPLRAALATLLTLPPPHYSDAQWQALGAIVALLPRAAAELKIVFGERGQADFTEIAQGALRALGDKDAPTDLLLALDVRVQHILVDEFQDTSISQWELLERLTAGWQSDDSGGDGRSLFLVGDPMQSIYRFREAEVGIFLQARRHGIGSVVLEPLALRTNFRSQAGIVEWLNHTFPQILPALEDIGAGAVPYAPASPHHPLQPGAAVTWHGFFESDKAAARVAEAQRVIDIIEARRQEVPLAKIAILVRSRHCLDDIVPALKQAGLRFRAIEIDHLGEKQVVQDLLALARALAHPADRVAWLAMLRAPWCGLGLEDLVRLAEATGEATLWEVLNDAGRLAQLSNDGRGRVMRLREVLDVAFTRRLRGSLRDRVEGVWLALGGPACVEEATALADAEVFLDHLAASESAGDLPDLAVFEDSLDKLYALPDLDAGENAIDIMTIHKAKGLQFDTVILPGLERGPGKNDSPLLVWQERADETLLLAPMRPAGKKRDAIYDYLRTVQKAAEDNEAGRLLYVAVTRAQTRLHLLACVGVAGAGMEMSLKSPPKRSLLAKAWPVAETALYALLRDWTPVAVSRSVVTSAEVEQKLLQLAPDWKLPPAPSPVQWQALGVERAAENEIEFSWVGETARQVGSVAHRWLQCIADDALEGWDTIRIQALGDIIRRQLTARGVAVAELPIAVARVQAALTGALNDPRGRWVLGPQRDAQTERRLTALVDGQRIDLVIDRTFRAADGQYWIIDYKTSSHQGADVEGFLNRERERYRAQLARYALAVAEQQGANVGLYFPLLAGWREWRAS